MKVYTTFERFLLVTCNIVLTVCEAIVTFLRLLRAILGYFRNCSSGGLPLFAPPAMHIEGWQEYAARFSASHCVKVQSRQLRFEGFCSKSQPF